MRTANESLIRTNGSVNIPWISDPILLSNISDYSVQLEYLTNGAEFKLQASLDQGKPLAQSWTGENITNWTDISLSVTQLTENGDILIDVAEASYRWVRVVVGGTGVITAARFNIKGV